MILRTPAELAALSRDDARRCSEELIDVLVAIHAVDYRRRRARRVRPSRRLRRAPGPALGRAVGTLEDARAPRDRRARAPAARRDPDVAAADDRARRLPPRQHDARARRSRARSSRCSTGRWRRSAIRSPTSACSSSTGSATTRRPATSARRSSPDAGFLSRDEVVERYATKSGRDVSQLDFYEMLAAYKLAIILEGIHARFLMGKTVGEGFDHIGVARGGHGAGRARPVLAVVDRRAAWLEPARSRRTRRRPTSVAAGRRPAEAGSEPARNHARGCVMGVMDGVKVLEVAEHGFVPSAAAILAEWGADVVKVERPTGDPAAPHHGAWAFVADTGDFNFLFEQFNRNKRGVAIDLRNDEGRAALDRLIEWADVFITNFLPSARTKLRARPRRHLGREPDAACTRSARARACRARCRPGRLRRGVVLGARRARAHAHAAGRPARAAPRRARRRAERRVPRGRRRRPRCSSASAPAKATIVDVSLLGAAVWTLAERPRAHHDPRHRAAPPRRGQEPEQRARRVVPRPRDERWISFEHARPRPPLGTDVPRARARRAARQARRTRPPRSASNARRSCTRSSSSAIGSLPLAELKERLSAHDTIYSSIASPVEVDRRPAGARQRLHARPIPDHADGAAVVVADAVRRRTASRSARRARRSASTPTRCSGRSASTTRRSRACTRPGRWLEITGSRAAHDLGRRAQLPRPRGRDRPAAARGADAVREVAERGRSRRASRSWCRRTCTQPDYEGELAVVIGTPGARRRARPTRSTYVAGVTVAHDVSARDHQYNTGSSAGRSRSTRSARSVPRSSRLDEVDLAAGLAIETRVSGEVHAVVEHRRSSCSRCRTSIAWISQGCTLEPGDMILTGTPAGVGAARTPPRWLVDGDVVEITIEGVGTLRNPVVRRESASRTGT